MVNDTEDIFRLNKYIAHCGVCNRKVAVDLIKKGEIMVNGTVAVNPFYELKPDDKVFFRGKLIIKAEKKVYLLFNKPKNMPVFQTTGYTKPTVLDLVKRKSDAKVQPAMAVTDLSSGLLLLTNDSELIEKMSGYDLKVKSVFEIVLDRPINDNDFNVISEKIKTKTTVPFIKGINFISDDKRSILGLESIGGFDADIIHFFAEHTYQVIKIDRMQLGALTKKDLKRGWTRYLTDQEVIFIKYF
jgi:23S rRNA pseudouridine2605 synthase